VVSGASKAEQATPRAADCVDLRSQAFAPDFAFVVKFIVAMIARGAITELVSAIVGLLTRMRDINTELLAKAASHKRKRPPNESMRRLQLELPWIGGRASNDAEKSNLTDPSCATDERSNSLQNIDSESKNAKPEKKKRGAKNPRPHGRPTLPEHLPRIPDVVPAQSRCCPKCGDNLTFIKHKSAKKLDIIPMQFVVVEVLREVLGCQHCHEHIEVAPKPDEVVDRGVLGNTLLVEAMVEHFNEAVPWNRMEEKARQRGVPLSANTLAASVGKAIDLFDPIVRHIREMTFGSPYIGLDATRMPVIDGNHPLGIRSGALWLIEGDHKYASFVYAPSGHAEHVEKLLANRTLKSVMCDGSATNNCVERAGGTRGGCNAHARRGLVDALRTNDRRALQGLDYFASVFHCDAESARLGETLEQRFERRQRDAKPVMEKLHAWVQQMRAEVEPKSILGKALGYIERQWRRLTQFLRDPKMELTNNEVERDLRRWVLDRKTWYFVGNEKYAQRTADALTLITTCRKFGIDPRCYLSATLEKILQGEKRLEALLPEAFQMPPAAQGYKIDMATNVA